LGEYDWIDSGNLEDECPCFNWMLNKLKKGISENWLCKMIQNIEESERYGLTIDVGDYDQIQNLPLSNGNSRMQIPEDLCNIPVLDSQGQLEAGAKFIHEFLHSHFFQLLADNWPDHEFDISQGFQVWHTEEWANLIRAEYGIPDGEPVTGNHHVDFYNFLKESIMTSIWELNGRIGDVTQYEYYANLMLNTADLASREQFGIPLGLGHYDSNGEYVPTFNNNDFLDDWNQVGGNDKFKLGC